METNYPDYLSIPSAAVETAAWTPINPEQYSKRERLRQTGSYESTIPADLVNWEPELTGELSAELEDSVRALTDFDQYSQRLLSSDSATLGPMSSILLRTESASSSQIEELTTTARQLALAEIGESRKSNALEVVANVRAMESALELANDINQDTLLAMHRELLQHQSGMEKYAGNWREQLVWIGRGSAGPLLADFVGPQPERILHAIDDLITFIGRDDLPILIQAAVAHAQFETIHPFVDGNGRTGRALVQAILKNKGFISHFAVPFSAGLLRDTQSYFDALGSFREGNAGPIVSEFVVATNFGVVSGKLLVDDLLRELEASADLLEGTRSDAVVWQVLPHLVGQPIVTSAYLQKALGLKNVTIDRALALLAERGVLKERTGFKRNRVWEHSGMLGVLDEYAETIKRRP